MSRTCDYCSNPLPDDVRRCPHCGAPVPIIAPKAAPETKVIVQYAEVPTPKPVMAEPPRFPKKPRDMRRYTIAGILMIVLGCIGFTVAMIAEPAGTPTSTGNAFLGLLSLVTLLGGVVAVVIGLAARAIRRLTQKWKAT